MPIISFLQQEQAAQPSGTMGLLGTIVPFLLIILIFYFFMIRPQNKKQKETQKMLDALKKGDKIVTIGGIHGVVSSVKDKTVIVKVDDNCKVEFTRSAIASCESDKSEEKTDKKSDKKSEKDSKEESSVQEEQKQTDSE